MRKEDKYLSKYPNYSNNFAEGFEFIKYIEMRRSKNERIKME